MFSFIFLTHLCSWGESREEAQKTNWDKKLNGIVRGVL